MADSINVPIQLPTDASSVAAAKGVVGALNDALKAIGPAAKKGSAEAQQQMAAFKGAAKAATTAAQEAAKQETARAKAAASAAHESAKQETVRAKAAADSARAQSKAEQAAQKHAQRVDAENQKAYYAHQAAQQKHAHKIHEERVKAEIAAEKRVAKERAAARAADQKDAQRAENKRERERKEAVKAAQREARGKAAGGGASGLLDAGLGSIAGMLPALMATTAAVVGVIAAKFSSALVTVMAFREATVNAFTAILRGSAAADKAFKDSIATADQIGKSYQEVLSAVNSLVAKGFKADFAQDIVKAMADLKAVVPTANIDKLILAITQVKGKGVLQMEELQGQIAEAGLSVSLVLEEIGKGIGKTGAEVRKMISQGQISADQGVAGIMAAIQRTTGKPIGKAAEEASKSLGGLLSRLEQIPQGLLLMADAGKGVSTLKDVLGNIVAAFAPSSAGGKALSASLGKLGNAFSTFLSGLTGKGGGDALQSLAVGLAGLVDSFASMASKIGAVVGPALGGFIKGLGAGLNMGNKAGKGAVDTTASFERLGVALGKVAEVTGKIVGAFAAIFAGQQGSQQGGGFLDTVTSSIERALSLMNMISSAASAVYAAATSIGSQLVAGIIAGINIAAPGLMAAVQALATMTTGASQAAHKISSPSKEWRDDIGVPLPEGGAEGIYKGAPAMARAAQDVAGATTGAASGAATTMASPGQIGPFYVYARTADDAQAISDAIERKLRSILSEFGGAYALPA